jgi:hypothetical protein
VVHQVGRAGDAGGRERQRLDEVRLRARGWRDGRARAVLVDVVGEADGDAAVGGADECALERLGERIREPQVVDRDVECRLSLVEPVGKKARDLFRRLAAVGERMDVYRAAFARSSALCARFAA